MLQKYFQCGKKYLLTVSIEPLVAVGGHAGDGHQAVGGAGGEAGGPVPVGRADGLQCIKIILPAPRVT